MRALPVLKTLLAFGLLAFLMARIGLEPLGVVLASLISLILSVTNLSFTLLGGVIYAWENVEQLQKKEGVLP